MYMTLAVGEELSLEHKQFILNYTHNHHTFSKLKDNEFVEFIRRHDK
jgi:hypothetical protein